ncbi:MAG: hypothetical protein LBT09_13775 [Planctomycetaceae bacterium]|nr:hypothetical protein [Planctomycetaceae bacterium]
MRDEKSTSRVKESMLRVNESTLRIDESTLRVEGSTLRVVELTLCFLGSALDFSKIICSGTEWSKRFSNPNICHRPNPPQSTQKVL